MNTVQDKKEWPLWEVFIRSKAGLDHKHCGSLHACDAAMAIQMARDVYTRRQEGTSIWVVKSEQIVASDPGDKDMYFANAGHKIVNDGSYTDFTDASDFGNVQATNRLTQSALDYIYQMLENDGAGEDA